MPELGLLVKRIIITGGSGFIGTNMIDFYSTQRVTILNLDKNPPKKNTHILYWRKCDILDMDELLRVFEEFSPDYVIHLAAETDVNGKLLSDYNSNFDGVSNLLQAVKASSNVKKVIITSTQYVNQFHGIPTHDQEYYPLGLYGESKVLTEKLTRSAELNCDWCIIRPTSIWGPWHNVYPEGIWLQILKGRYRHPGKQKVIRSYGYVGNVIYQIEQLLSVSSEQINGKVFYVGDESTNLYGWVNSFSIALTGKNVKIAPRALLRALSFFGDGLKHIGISFPLTSSRYKNMILDNPCDMQKTFRVTGKNPFNLEEGVKITVDWYFKTYLKKHRK